MNELHIRGIYIDEKLGPVVDMSVGNNGNVFANNIPIKYFLINLINPVLFWNTSSEDTDYTLPWDKSVSFTTKKGMIPLRIRQSGYISPNGNNPEKELIMYLPWCFNLHSNLEHIPKYQVYELGNNTSTEMNYTEFTVKLMNYFWIDKGNDTSFHMFIKYSDRDNLECIIPNTITDQYELKILPKSIFTYDTNIQELFGISGPVTIWRQFYDTNSATLSLFKRLGTYNGAIPNFYNIITNAKPDILNIPNTLSCSFGLIDTCD